MNDKSAFPQLALFNDNDRADEIIALKTLVFSILRNSPHKVTINKNRTIEKNNKKDLVLTRLCTEMTDAMIATTTMETHH